MNLKELCKAWCWRKVDKVDPRGTVLRTFRPDEYYPALRFASTTKLKRVTKDVERVLRLTDDGFLQVVEVPNENP